MNRRRAIGVAAGAVAAAGAGAGARGPAPQRLEQAAMDRDKGLRLAVKLGMVRHDGPLAERFALLKELGYDGVELDAPGGPAAEVVREAASRSGVFVHGVVDSVHWRTRLSDPDEGVREEAVAALERAVRDAHAYGAFSVLLVPAVVQEGHATHEQAWERSIAGIRRVLPLAAGLGVHILIENVWNGFLYDPDGGDEQSAELLAKYIDEIDSPWVGVYFDIGNHRKFGRPEEWISTLGRRIVKLDVKDWSREKGWTKIGEGDVDWAAVRGALGKIGFNGWATAEVGGGGEARLGEILANMRGALHG